MLEKILYIVDTLCIGGRERIIVDTCNYLTEHGYEVYVCSLVSDNNPLASQLSPKVIFSTLPTRENAIIGMRSFFNGLDVIRLLSKKIQHISPQVIHTHSYLHRLLMVNMAIRQSKIRSRVFHTVHTSGLYYSKSDIISRFKRQIERVALRLTYPSLIAVSPIVQDNNVKYYQSVTRHSRFIPNGIDVKRDLPARNDVRESLQIKETDQVLVYIARLVPGKNHITLIKAIVLLRNSFPCIKLFLVGDGELLDQLKTVASKGGIENHVIFTGSVSDVKPYLTIANIGVFPSEYEGFSMSILEMMAAGLPIIASNIAIFKYLITDFKNGLLFETCDETQLSEKIALLLRDEALRREMGNNAKSRASDFSFDVTMRKLVKYYKNID